MAPSASMAMRTGGAAGMEGGAEGVLGQLERLELVRVLAAEPGLDVGEDAVRRRLPRDEAALLGLAVQGDLETFGGHGHHVP